MNKALSKLTDTLQKPCDTPRTWLKVFVWFACMATIFPLQAFAFGAIIHYQGEVNDREVYFADLRTIFNKTPAGLIFGGTEIYEINVTVVYENPDKPEFTHLRIQFQCPASFSVDGNLKLTENKNTVKVGDTVKFRISEGSYKLRRADLKSEPVAATDWKVSSSPLLSKAGAISCNSNEIDRALHAAIRGKDFDFNGFGKRISQFGLPTDMMLVGQVLPSEFLDFAWLHLWWDTYLSRGRPDPSGRWAMRPSNAEKEASIKRLEELQKQVQPQVDAAKASLMEGIKKSQETATLRGESALSADGRKRPKIEANLVILWRGRSESEVVKAMGNPQFNQAGGARFLRYTKYWEKPGSTLYNLSGTPIAAEPGAFGECFVEFRTRQDSDGEWRVDDIMVRANDHNFDARVLCQDLANQAAR